MLAPLLEIGAGLLLQLILQGSPLLLGRNVVAGPHAAQFDGQRRQGAPEPAVLLVQAVFAEA
jgi:hypothetical protein